MIIRTQRRGDTISATVDGRPERAEVTLSPPPGLDDTDWHHLAARAYRMMVGDTASLHGRPQPDGSHLWYLGEPPPDWPMT